MLPITLILVTLASLNAQMCAAANASKLLELTRDSLTEQMLSGRMLFVYFGNQVSPTLELFLEQLERSAEALEDYGITVAKINCTKENIPIYCGNERLMQRAYLFRGREELRSFNIDTVFDVSAIVSHVLFTVLFDEVRYVHTPAELQAVEKAARGKIDVVFGHIQVHGLPEHRALMEAAFVYGSKFQFVLTTGGPLLKHMGVEDPSSLQAGLWLLHCKGVGPPGEPCPHTAMRRPLTTLNIHTFLQLIQAPLVTEAWVDPVEVEVGYSQFQVPLLFLFLQPETAALDWDAAQGLAWALRGHVGVVLIHRDSPKVKSPLKYNAAYRLSYGAAVKYVTFDNMEEVISLFSEQQRPVGEERTAEEEEEEGEEEEEEEGGDPWSSQVGELEDQLLLDVLDDEVAASVYHNRHQILDQEPVIELTADLFKSALAQYDHLVVLFYAKWDAVSMAFLSSFVEVAEALEGLSDVALGSVDCGEWTDVCGDQGITSFPVVMVHHRGDDAQTYRGMLGSQSLQSFILLSRVSSPVRLSSSEEVQAFMEGALGRSEGATEEDLYIGTQAHSPVRVLGVYGSNTDPGVPLFEAAARALRGQMLLGMLDDTSTQNWALELSVDLPVLLVQRGPHGQREVHSIQASSLDALIAFIHNASLDPFPELTVENLPDYLELRRPLLLLFVAEEGPESAAALLEMQALLQAGHLKVYMPCWINLQRTPAGGPVLESYLGAIPKLPALVLSQLHGGGEVFHFPSHHPLQAGRILHWLQSVEHQQDQPAGLVPDEKWPPSRPFFDFLSVMDQEMPGYAAQRSSRREKEMPPGYAAHRSPRNKMAATDTTSSAGEKRLEGEKQWTEDVEEERGRRRRRRKEERRKEGEKDPDERQGSRTPANTPSPLTHSEL